MTSHERLMTLNYQDNAAYSHNMARIHMSLARSFDSLGKPRKAIWARRDAVQWQERARACSLIQREHLGIEG